MNLLEVVVPLVVAGVALFAINKWIPMQEKIKSILNWVVIGIVIIWLLKISGILDYLKSISF